MTSALARALVLDELFDLALYRSVRRFASGDLALMLDELITIETRHAAFWQRFFGVTIDRLDRGRHIKLAMLSLACRVFMARRIDPERVRNFFLGFNDGLVEILGAVSGFFAAFSDVASVLVASCTVAVALSMAAGAFAAAHSEREVRRVETGKRAFLG